MPYKTCIKLAQFVQNKKEMFILCRCETGVERGLENCRWQSNSGAPLRCNTNKDVVGIECHLPEEAYCDGSAKPFRDKCYEVHIANM